MEFNLIIEGPPKVGKSLISSLLSEDSQIITENSREYLRKLVPKMNRYTNIIADGCFLTKMIKDVAMGGEWGYMRDIEYGLNPKNYLIFLDSDREQLINRGAELHDLDYFINRFRAEYQLSNFFNKFRIDTSNKYPELVCDMIKEYISILERSK